LKIYAQHLYNDFPMTPDEELFENINFWKCTSRSYMNYFDRKEGVFMF